MASSGTVDQVNHPDRCHSSVVGDTSSLVVEDRVECPLWTTDVPGKVEKHPHQPARLNPGWVRINRPPFLGLCVVH